MQDLGGGDALVACCSKVGICAAINGNELVDDLGRCVRVSVGSYMLGCILHVWKDKGILRKRSEAIWSVGDFVITGDISTPVVIDACIFFPSATAYSCEEDAGATDEDPQHWG